MEDYSSCYSAREKIVEILKRDFIGPVSEDEILTELPTQYYLLGKLYPKQSGYPAGDNMPIPLVETSTDNWDTAVSLSNQYNPSSLALTCSLKPGVDKIRVRGSYAIYQKITAEEAGIAVPREEETDENAPHSMRKPKERNCWRRQPFLYDKVFDLNGRMQEEGIGNDLLVRVYEHRLKDSPVQLITVALINDKTSETGNAVEDAEKSVFQVQMRLSGVNPEEPIFTSSDHASALTKDPEIREMDLLYRRCHTYAQGHGCSAMWDTEKESTYIDVSFMPDCNLLQMKPADIECGQLFHMKFLAYGKAEEILPLLHAFVKKYRTWIAKVKQKAEHLPDASEREIGLENVSRCEMAANRILHSIELLQPGSTPMRAFQLANEAMLLQRKHSLERDGRKVNVDDIRWYPFQLAFILQELSSFIEPNGEDRKLVDLLWFPTGGGKTEAYLGISAFVIFLRRLRDPSADGVTVMMRYTLRLLTLQQFERAETMICACEYLREKYHLGGSEISIGLWVGNGLTPNAIDDAAANLIAKRNGMLGKDKADPCQILRCPWCGQEIRPSDYTVDRTNKKMRVRCSREGCFYHERAAGIPVHIVDEDIYSNLPTYIVATIDKFAQMPLSDKPAALFGISSKKKPPELIIQDELHLISGSLGTITGIYEAAITAFCTRDGVPAKVVASTATIRNAASQIRSLYGRDHAQFPPQGIDVDDSFFAVKATELEKPARLYLGVMGVGTSATSVMVRAYAAMLFATRYLTVLGYPDEVIDNFWTITGYFNTIRELGAARTQIMDVVQKRFSFLAGKKFVNVYPGVNPDEDYTNMDELTSRMDDQTISDVITNRLLRSYHDGQHKDVYDFLIATNMMSVGVDIGRLGVMVVEGQPKSNAEYIQATSRVGRSKPGLVLMLYHAGRSRDRSHYEQFLHYHNALYRYVEATSLTPFSERAQDRALHALYVALVRYTVPGMLPNSAAQDYDPNDPAVQRVRDRILTYVRNVDPDEYETARISLRNIEAYWESEVQAGGRLVYRAYFKPDARQLLKPDVEDDPFRTMNSMRNVDVQCGIYLMK